jgi:hypothetical protein
MSGMVESAVRDRRVVVDIANLEPDELGERISTFGDIEVNLIRGTNCLSQFTRQYRDRAADSLVREVASIDREDRPGSHLIASNSERKDVLDFIHIQEIREDRDGIVTLIAGPKVDSQELLNSQPAVGLDHPPGPQGPNLGNLIQRVQNATALVFRRDGVDSAVVGWARLEHTVIQGNWFILVYM